MKKLFNLFLPLIILCSCSPSYDGFVHKSLQPYYIDCEFQDEYSIEDISIKIYLGLWHDAYVFNGYSKDTNVFIYANETKKDIYKIDYKESSLILKQYDYASIANNNYVFSTNKKNHQYYVTYNNSEKIKIPSKIFNNDKGYISIAFSFMILVDNEFHPSGGSGLNLGYQKKDDSRISFF